MLYLTANEIYSWAESVRADWKLSATEPPIVGLPWMKVLTGPFARARPPICMQTAQTSASVHQGSPSTSRAMTFIPHMRAATYPATFQRFNPRSSNRSAAIRAVGGRCKAGRAPRAPRKGWIFNQIRHAAAMHSHRAQRAESPLNKAAILFIFAEAISAV